MKNTLIRSNPFRPGAGHRPPFLAGRTAEKAEFTKLLEQEVILDNMILTGLRGSGKTVLLEEFKGIAQSHGWQWAGTDCSESASVTEETIAIRILTDIALLTSSVVIDESQIHELGFTGETTTVKQYLDFQFLLAQYNTIPGLPIDKLKRLLLFVWEIIGEGLGASGIIFAYDEAQTLSDHSEDQQYPLSVLLDLFQYLQRSGARFMLVLTGLPTLLTKLVEARTYTERFFRVLMLDKLNHEESQAAICKPIEKTHYAKQFTGTVVNQIIEQSGGYPYFIQFICREVCDSFVRASQDEDYEPSIPMDAIIQKLDNDFFAGRWSRATDRERELMTILARSGKAEFSVQETSTMSETSEFNNFSSSLVSQSFARLIDKGLLYKDRRGTYLFAVPLLAEYIQRLSKKNSKPMGG